MKRKTSMKGTGKKLLIVESPAKIKTISKFLGRDFKIMSTLGHIKDLPPKKIGVTIDEKKKSIDLDYSVIENKDTVIKDICRQAKTASEVFLATDPDREGEIISWHIAQEIRKVFKDEDKIHRITFNEITKDAISQAINDQSVINEDQVNAQQARRVLDRWVGYEVSPILWKKITKGLSAGRVQSVALLLVCKRDDEIKNFKPEESWSIHAIFKTDKKGELTSELFKVSSKAFKLKNKAEADKVLEAIKKESFKISKITERKRAKKPTAPFMTSTLQQDAYNKLGFSVDKTMRLAQRLYEGISLGDQDNPEAMITYMRTDSLRVSDSALKAVREFVKKEYGDKYLPKSANVYGKKGAQDAHEAIRPIDVRRTPDFVKRHAGRDEARLYALIWKRFTASQMSPAEYFMRQVLIDGGKYTFKATGSTLVFDGFLKVYLVEDEDSDKAVKIPKDIAADQAVKLGKPEGKQHFTQPPPRYSEATLVKELEKQGIGRPSTYAATLSTIQKRAYVEKENKRFTPTELGKAVNEMLTQNLPDVINVKFTAGMEEDLDKIAQGEANRDKVLLSFYKTFKKDLEAFGGKEVGKKAVETDVKCPKCKSQLMMRFGRSGEFLGCSGYPECKFTSNFERDDKGKIKLVAAAPPAESDIKCPNCGKNLVQKIGRYGPFLTCPGYPDCKYIHQESLKTPCPKCNNKLVKRRWRGGTFWGCAGYPKCNFSIFGDVIETPCPKCKLPYVTVVKSKKTEEVKHVCSDKACGWSQVVEEA